MSTTPATIEIEYPESDGQPVGETDLHIDWLFRLRDMLKHRYRDQQTYVAADLLLYYEEGNPGKFIVPDVFVVTGCDPMFRRVYKLWEEQPPHVAFELTSRSTRRNDEIVKPKQYARMGIREYFLYDPAAEYLLPPLQGYRLDGKSYRRIERDEQGRLLCQQLNLLLGLDSDGGLLLFDRESEERLLTGWEAAARAQDEADRADEAAACAQEEIARLRRLLDEQSAGE